MRGRKPSEIDAVPGALDVLPVAPDWLPPEGMEEWNRVGADLVGRRGLSASSLSTFGAYCAAVANVQRAQRGIAGNEVVDVKGVMKRNPLYNVMFQALTESRRLAAELGLTPAAATRRAPRGRDQGGDSSGSLFDLADLDL